MRAVVALLAGGLALAGCSSGNGHRAAKPESPTTTLPSKTLCGTDAQCFDFFHHGGATAVEARCLVPVTHMPVGPDNGRSWSAGVTCVGSSQRLATIIDASSKWSVAQFEKNFGSTTTSAAGSPSPPT